jgi:tetratricopeptide (TPR) repeat protein
LLGLLLAWPLTAEEPKPPWQRLLQGDDAKQADKLLARRNELFTAEKYAEAAAAAQELLALRQRVQGKDHWQAADEREQVNVLRRLAKGTAQERADFRRGLTAAAEAQALEAKGRHAQAQPLRERSLALFRELFGEEDLYTTLGANNLAMNLNAQGKYAEAEEGFRKALALRLKLLGEEHPLTTTSYNNLSLNLNAQGKYAEAEKGFRQALALRRHLLGEEHSLTAQGYNNLAGNLNSQGKYAEAEKGYRQALALRRKLLGEEHSDTAEGYNNLAANLLDQGKFAEAEEGYRQALALRRKLLGEEHPETAVSYINLAVLRDKQGNYAEAEEGMVKAVAILHKVLGEKHPLTATGYNNLAMNLNHQGKYAEAEAGFRTTLALRRELLGEEHPLTALSYNNLAHNLQEQDKYALAEETYRTALALRRKRLGEEHPLTADSYNNLGYNLTHQGKYTEAEESLRTAAALYRKLLGAEHPDTAASSKNLAINLAARQRYREAEEELGRAADVFAHAQPRLASSGLDRARRTGERSPLPFLAALLARNGKPELAWQRYEASRGHATRDELTARMSRSPEDQARLAELARQLERLDQALEAHTFFKQPTEEQTRQHKERLTQRRRAQEQLDALTQELADRHGLGQARPYPLDKIQAALPASAALLGWVDFQPPGKVGEAVNERWAVLLRARGKPIWAPLKGSGPGDAWTEADDRLPDELARALASHPRAGQADWRDLARRLARQRLEPLAPHLAATADLPAVGHLIVLPSGLMDGVPVEVLTDRCTVSRAPSATLFAFLRDKPKPKTTGLLAVADPVFDRPDPKAKPAPVPPGGLLLTAVVPGSRADGAGLKRGDVLLRYRDQPLKNPADLPTLSGAANPEARVTVEVWRDGDTFAVEVAPGPLGVAVAKEPAPDALAARRRIDAEVAAGRGGGVWKALPGARVEAEMLARRCQEAGQPITLLSDSEASEQRLAEVAGAGTLAKVRYLHLATHGTVNWWFPLQSAVILARDRLPDPWQQLDAGLPVYDGRLTAAKVLRDWNLDAELVTLSACETGLGRHAEGESYLGFAQALLLVGSRSVCLSLWQVDDAATALLMDRFYANLLGQREGLKQGLGKAEALDEAKRWLRVLPRAEAVKLAARLTGGVQRGKGRPALPLLPAVPQAKAEDEPPYAHPYYWAAFVLIGDAD